MIAYWAYNLLIAASAPVLLLFWLASLMNPKYRTGWKDRLGILSPALLKATRRRRLAWMHLVSVGEVNAAVPLIRRIKSDYPDIFLAVSTVTVTGNFNARRQLPHIDGLFYFPFDFVWVIKRIIRHLHPVVFIVFETEIWPNLIYHLRKDRIPIFLLNARLSDKSLKRYRFISGFISQFLLKIDYVLAQSERDRQRFILLGADSHRVVVTGNTKFDQMQMSGSVPYSDVALLRNWNWWVAGSTHSGEEEMILSAFLKAKLEFPALGLILAPRHPERWNDVAGILVRLRIPFIRKSEWSAGVPEWKRVDSPVILLDTIGELSDFYYWATIAFVGGSLVPKGGHNILEPALWGKAPFFGPHMDNFTDISELFEQAEAGIKIDDPSELSEKVIYFLRKPDELADRGKRSKELLLRMQGATERNLMFISKYLS